ARTGELRASWPTANSAAEQSLSSQRLVHCLSLCAARGWCASARFTGSECHLLLPDEVAAPAGGPVQPVHSKPGFPGRAPLSMSVCRQSTIWGASNLCGKAMDGDVSQLYPTCFSTASGPNQWWEAEAPDEAFITEVTLYNRAECCQSRLNNFVIEVDGAACVDFVTANAFSVRNFSCNRRGRRLRVTSRLNDALTICEVTAYGFV
uniref:FTP domain-containing protein n=1 Tax=Macrostomum lignano TaxID=282301 RepID=A0A1I8GJC4_9PLAT